MKLEGTVEHVIYENADSGYAVFEVDAGGTDVVVAGNVGGVDNGMSVTVYGHMVNHPSYGEQFRAETIEARLPEDRTAILSYLSSGVLPYIGPSTAKKIVAKFGDDTLTVIAETPQRLCELKGITEQKAAIISNEFRRMYGVREVVAWFARYGMTAQQAVTCYRALGPHTVEALPPPGDGGLPHLRPGGHDGHPAEPLSALRRAAAIKIRSGGHHRGGAAI